MPDADQHYPICQFLRRLLEETDLDRDAFVRSLGYRNLERGRRRLDLWMDSASGYQNIIKQITAAYPDRADELAKAIADTAEVKQAEFDELFLARCKSEEETFHPFVHVRGETTVPRQITFFGLTGGHDRWTVIKVPKAILALPLEEQLEKLPDLMRAYLREHRGQCPFFGAVTGFRYVRLMDYFQFDSEARLLEHVEKPYRLGGCWVELC